MWSDPQIRLRAKRHLEPDDDVWRKGRQDVDQRQLARSRNHALEARLLHVVRDRRDERRVGELDVPDELRVERRDVLRPGARADEVHRVDEEPEISAADRSNDLDPLRKRSADRLRRTELEVVSIPAVRRAP